MSNATLVLWILSLTSLIAALAGMYSRKRASSTSCGQLAAALREDKEDLMKYQEWKRRTYSRTITLQQSIELEAAYVAGRREMRGEMKP